MAVTANIGGENYTSTDTKTPYKNMYDQYETNQKKTRDAYVKRLDNDQATRQTDINNQYNNSAQQNYVRYMQNKKSLPAELNAQGITGGASESALLRLGTNYGTNIANNESARNASLAALAQDYANKKATYDEEMDQRLQNAYLTMMENQQKYEKEQQEKDLQYFANSITGRFGTLDEYDALIKELQGSDDINKDYKIALAQQARQALATQLEQLALQKASYSSGGGGGGYRSYSGGGSGSSGGGSTVVSIPQEGTDAIANYVASEVVQNTPGYKSPYDQAANLTNRVINAYRPKSYVYGDELGSTRVYY